MIWFKQLFCNHEYPWSNPRCMVMTRDYVFLQCPKCGKVLLAIPAIAYRRIVGLIVTDAGQVLGSVQNYEKEYFEK